MKKVADFRKRFLIQDASYSADAMEFIRSSLLELGINRKLVQKTELLCEESIIMLAEHAPEGAELQVQIRRFFGDASVSLSMQGEQYSPYLELPENAEDSDLLLSEEAIRSILLRSHGEKYRYRHKGGVNYVRILTGQSERSSTRATFIALALGLLLGLLAKLVFPQVLTDAICSYALEPARTMFMNALKIVIAPVVFFSIVTCLSQFHSLADFGKLGAKVLGMYLLTTLIAELIGIGVSFLLRPGAWGFALSGSTGAAAVSVDTDVETGLLYMIVNIVPSNFFAPFLESNTLQIIFLAVLCGFAVGTIGRYAPVLRELFEACNSLFLAITSMIAKLIPLAVFASVALMVIQLGGDSMLSVLGAGGVQLAGVTVMMCAYTTLIVLLARLNPLIFFKKIRQGMLTSFTLSSSSAAMPTNLRICTEKLGISPKVANFSIPLGATINMDGFCIFLTVMGMFMARAYGVAIPPSGLLTMAITVILLSLGAPGVPGGGLVCLGIVLKTLHVPVEALGLIIAIYPLLDMLDTASNTSGDMAAALIVAKRMKLLDLDTYRS